jgi:hypothetical protein
MYTSISPLLLGICLITSLVSADNVLIVGDSIAEYMGRTLETFCPGSQVYNVGKSGSTAEGWTKISSDVVKDCKDTEWDQVYMSIGGNDVLDSGCSITAEELYETLDAAVTNIATNIAPGASTYLLTGYCIASGPASGGCATPEDMSAFSEVFEMMQKDGLSVQDQGINVVVLNSFTECGGSASSFSDDKYFADAIHLNDKGYCSVFTQPEVQDALHCGETSFDCETFELDLYGLNDKECPAADHDDHDHDDDESNDGFGLRSRKTGSIFSVLIVLVISLIV